jgi:hypothetical protein
MLLPLPPTPAPIQCPPIRMPDIAWVPVPTRKPVPVPARVH